ncbi:hypothetical protein RBI22_15430 [Alcaligenaceae bacterium C4P045]|nr:hypothetical protein [Alcaligenaceae bacterium C4P045]
MFFPLSGFHAADPRKAISMPKFMSVVYGMRIATAMASASNLHRSGAKCGASCTISVAFDARNRAVVVALA